MDECEKASESLALLSSHGSSVASRRPAVCNKRISIALAVVVGVGALCLVLLVSVRNTPRQINAVHDVSSEARPANEGVYTDGAVATDASQCSSIGRRMLERNGSSVDAAIASMLCVGVHNSQSTGVAGSSFMLIYERPNNGRIKELRALNFRDAAPLRASTDMFIDIPPNVDKNALEIAVFGEIAGYWEAWKKYGRLAWNELFEPSIDLCKNGFVIGQALGEELTSNYFMDRARKDEGNMREFFFREDGSSYRVGDVMKRPKLAQTLQRIADGGAREFYRGSLAKDIIADLKELGSIIELDDLLSYTARWEDAMVTELKNANMWLATPGAPSGGPVLQMIMQLIDGYDWNSKNYVQQYHWLAEIFKFSYALKTRIGDPYFVNVSQVVGDITDPLFIADTMRRIDDARTHDIAYYEPHIGFSTDTGTSHLSVLSPDGAAVAITSSVNTGFGSFRRGKRTGLIFNDGMDDFATSEQPNYWNLPPSYANIIKPGKRPLSSMSPTLVFDRTGAVRVSIGGAGGSYITTSIANALWHMLYHNEDISFGLSTARLHHQLSPNTLALEEHMPPRLVMGLSLKGHEIDRRTSIAVLQGIQKVCDDDTAGGMAQCKLLAVSDIRKGGKPDGF